MASKGRKEENKYEKKERQEASQWSSVGLVMDILGGLISWSIFSQTAADIFYYPMVAMEFTGFEVFLASLMSVSLLGNSTIRKFSVTNVWLLKLLSATAFFAFYMPEVVQKLPLEGIGLAADMLGNYGIWIGAFSTERSDRSIIGHLLGLAAFVAYRMGFRSLDPVWAVTEANLIAIGACVVMSMYYFTERVEVKTISTEKGLSSIMSGLGIGSVFFLTTVFCSEHGVISRWVELSPFPYGIGVVLALIIGALVSKHYAVTSFLYWLVMAGGGWLLFISSAGTIFPPHVEYAGGLLLSVYTISEWLTLLGNASSLKNPGRAFVVGGLWNMIIQLWAVYVVAYKFVPGGFLLRERSKSMVFIPLVFMGLATVNSFLPAKPKVSSRIRGKAIAAAFLVTLLVLTPASLWRAYHQSLKPDEANPPVIKPLAWAIHFGYNNWGNVNAYDLANVIKQSGANVIGMVETDTARHYMGNRDIIEWLSEELHYHSDFGPSSAQNSWGCALLSVWPIERSARVIMPSPQGELACLIDADLRINGTVVNIVVAHFGNTDDPLDLELQGAYLTDLIKKKKDTFSPTIFIGYLTTDPYTDRYVQLIQAGFHDTITSLDRYCLYVLYKDVKTLDLVRYDKGDISDTEAQMGSFLLTQPQPKLTASPDLCRKFNNDSVSCQAVDVCGWCQLSKSGHCYEPEQRPACLSFDGIWVGPEIANNLPSEEDRTSFINIQHEQQQKGLYPLVQLTDNIFQWTVNDFAYLDSWSPKWASSIFKAKGCYWRIWVNMFQKRAQRADRVLKVFLEKVDGTPEKGTAEFTIVNTQSLLRSTTQVMPIGATKTIDILGYEQLYNQFIQNDKFTIEVKFN